MSVIHGLPVISSKASQGAVLVHLEVRLRIIIIAIAGMVSVHALLPLVEWSADGYPSGFFDAPPPPFKRRGGCLSLCVRGIVRDIADCSDYPR